MHAWFPLALRPNVEVLDAARAAARALALAEVPAAARVALAGAVGAVLAAAPAEAAPPAEAAAPAEARLALVAVATDDPGPVARVADYMTGAGDGRASSRGICWHGR